MLPYSSELGNQMIKRLAASFDMVKVGTATQYRNLSFGALGLAGETRVSGMDGRAALDFGLYMGNTARIIPVAMRYARYLDSSLFEQNLV